jgi:hypothetical protein
MNERVKLVKEACKALDLFCDGVLTLEDFCEWWAAWRKEAGIS